VSLNSTNDGPAAVLQTSAGTSTGTMFAAVAGAVLMLRTAAVALI
tara:strand:- start:179 stop:313 length:135 start_codon:yes stop_codon:yes gene_type:complete